MSDKPDWEAIQREYEDGTGSFREIADRYGVAPTTLYRRSQKWNGTERNTEKSGTERNGTPKKVERNGTEQSNISSIHVLRSVLPSPVNAVEIAKLGLKAVLKIMKENDEKEERWDLGELVKAANASTQFNKIVINAPHDSAEDEEEEDLSGFSEDEVRMYAEFQERAKKRA